MFISLKSLGIRFASGRSKAVSRQPKRRLEVERLEDLIVPSTIPNLTNAQFALNVSGHAAQLLIQQEKIATGELVGVFTDPGRAAAPVVGVVGIEQTGSTTAGLFFQGIGGQSIYFSGTLTGTGTNGGYYGSDKLSGTGIEWLSASQPTGVNITGNDQSPIINLTGADFDLNFAGDSAELVITNENTATGQFLGQFVDYRTGAVGSGAGQLTPSANRQNGSPVNGLTFTGAANGDIVFFSGTVNGTGSNGNTFGSDQLSGSGYEILPTSAGAQGKVSGNDIDRIDIKYAALGGASGFLGNAGGAEKQTPDGSGLYKQFQGGTIYWSPGTGAHVVYGAIGVEYAATASQTDANGGNVQKDLGLPTSDEMNVPSVAGARMNTFQGGTIYWSPGTGAHVVYGAIGVEYAATASQTDANGGNVQKDLGLPTREEMNVPGVAGARMNTFQGAVIYWSPGTGAHVVYGAIGGLYNRMGGPTSSLGLPTSDEQNAPSDGRTDYRVNYFQNGKIWWTPADGAHAVQAVSSMDYDPGYVSFPDPVPVGGSVHLTVYADGSYHFVGHLRDSGPLSYNDNVMIGLVSPSGRLWATVHSGHMAGFFESGSRDDTWDLSGNDPKLAANWADLEGDSWYLAANVDADWNPLVNHIEQAVGIALGVVGIVVAS
jgi:hypothetical protein